MSNRIPTAQTAPAPRTEADPRLSRRERLLVAGLGVVGVSAVVFFGARDFINAHNQDALNAELSHPFPDVAADIRSGEINPDDVTRFKVGTTEYAWSVASDLTHKDHEQDTAIVSSIIQAQQGSSVENGSQIIVPNSEIDPQS